MLWRGTVCAIVSGMAKIKTYALFTMALVLFFALVLAISNRVFLERYVSTGGHDILTLPVAWYEPKDAVPGNPQDSLPIALDAKRTIPDSTLSDVATYAEAQGSQSLIIVHKGEIQFEQYWGGATRETLFNPQSMSKSILALLMGIAIAEGDIGSVNDPIGQYIEEWRDDPRGKATIKQALRMSSGLEQMSNSYEISLFNPAAWHFLADDFNEMLFELKQVNPPGENFDYSNYEADLLGIVIEGATGQRYADYLSEKLWVPLGLADAALYLDQPNGATMKSCCIFSRAYDWAKIGLLVSNMGEWDGTQIVPAEWITDMITPSPLMDFYGYFVWLGSSYIQIGEKAPPKSDVPVAPENYRADDMITFLGYGEQRVWISPSNELIIVRGTKQWSPSWNETKIPNAILDAITASSVEGESE